MKYIVIDQAGTLYTRTADDYTEALEEVGPEGWNRVQLTRDLAAFVNDVGLVMTDRYARNRVGGVLLMCFGAQQIPYAGPIVVTGWDQRLTRLGESEVIGLSEVQARLVSLVHTWVETILWGGEATKAGPVGAELHALADVVSTGDVPGWEVHSS